MTDTARNLLVDGGTCPFEKVRVVPHGAPPVLARRASELAIKRALGEPTGPGDSSGRLDDRFLLSTFGLISAGKGLETVIEALPAIVEKHPDVLYLIAGRTHPDISHREGERYRMSLERAVLDLGLESHVEFDDRFLSIDEIADLLAATDVFVTPYRAQEQISSGALTFAIAAGCGVVSTPYWYAQDMLESGAGTIVPFADPAALASRRLPLHRGPGCVDGRTRRGTADRRAARVAVGRRGNGRCPPRGRRAGAAPTAIRGARPAARHDANRPPAHARGRRRDHPARERGHSEPRERVLRRRRRPPRRRCARARPAGRRAGLDVDRLPLARVPPGRDRSRRPGTAELHGLRPALARRARITATTSGARSGRSARSSRPRGSRPSSGRPSGCSTRSCGRSPPTASLRTGAYAALGLARLDPDRLDPVARGVLKGVLEQLAAAYSEHADRGLALVRGPSSRTTTPACRTRSSSVASRWARTR